MICSHITTSLSLSLSMSPSLSLCSSIAVISAFFLSEKQHHPDRARLSSGSVWNSCSSLLKTLFILFFFFFSRNPKPLAATLSLLPPFSVTEQQSSTVSMLLVGPQKMPSLTVAVHAPVFWRYIFEAPSGWKNICLPGKLFHGELSIHACSAPRLWSALPPGITKIAPAVDIQISTPICLG